MLGKQPESESKAEPKEGTDFVLILGAILLTWTLLFPMFWLLSTVAGAPDIGLVLSWLFPWFLGLIVLGVVFLLAVTL